MQVKRAGVWDPATEIETFAYYDFLVRYPLSFRNYHSEKRALKYDEELSDWLPSSKAAWKSTWTTIPREYTTAEENEDVQFQITRDASNQRSIYVANVLDNHNNRQISDVAWRHNG